MARTSIRSFSSDRHAISAAAPHRSISTPLWLALVLLTPAAALAQSEAVGDVSGRVMIGVRAVSVAGAEAKFRQHVNLDAGPRLAQLDFDFTPSGELDRFADELSFRVDNFGGDPFESLRFGARKFGRYTLEYQRRRSAFFYEDVLPSGRADHHAWDFDRVRDTATFRAFLTPSARLTLAFDRHTKRGDSLTTLDIERREIQMSQPVDETMKDFTLGFEYAWPIVTLALEERFRAFETHKNTFFPGTFLDTTLEGLDGLDFFFLDQPYDFASFEQTVRVHARASDQMNVSGAFRYQTLDLDATAVERARGLTFRGVPFETEAVGAGGTGRASVLFDLDASYLVNDRFALVGGARRHDLDQEGDFTFATTLSRGQWDLATTGVEGAAQLSVAPEVTVTGGLRYETRDVTFAHGESVGGIVLVSEEEQTDHTGFFSDVSWTPSRRLRVSGEVELSAYDNPFTLASPTGRRRYRLRGRYDFLNGVLVSGTYLAYRFENDNSEWTADRDQVQLRLHYRDADVNASVGLGLIGTDRQIDQQVRAGGATLLRPVLFAADSTFVDARARWRLDDRWAVGGDLRYYDNGGSFELRRDDGRLFAEVTVLERYLVHVAYRYIDYQETLLGLNDYRAHIGELSFGYRW